MKKREFYTNFFWISYQFLLIPIWVHSNFDEFTVISKQTYVNWAQELPLSLVVPVSPRRHLRFVKNFLHLQGIFFDAAAV